MDLDYHPSEELQSGDYSVEITEELKTRYARYGDFIIRDHNGNLVFRLVLSARIKFNYRIVDALGNELGELKAGLPILKNGICNPSYTIIEALSKNQSKVRTIRSENAVLSIDTPIGAFYSPKMAIFDPVILHTVYDSQNRLVLSVERLRRLRNATNGSTKLAIFRSEGILNPFLICAIGMSFVLTSLNFFGMRTLDIEIREESSTVVNIERKRRGYVFTDIYGQELLRGRRKMPVPWFLLMILSLILMPTGILLFLGIVIFESFSAYWFNVLYISGIGFVFFLISIFSGAVIKPTFIFKDQTGQPVGQIQSNLRHSKWTIMDAQEETTGQLDIGHVLETGSSQHLFPSNKVSSNLITEFDNFTVGEGVASNRELYDSKGRLCYSIFGYNKHFKIDIKKCLTPDFWFFVSVCLIEQFFIYRQ
ncbi:MAG: hypothetical protein ACTSV9_03940, partial [Candidatus Thorarchaeota archaeon]